MATISIPVFSEKLDRSNERSQYRVRPVFFDRVSGDEGSVLLAWNEREDRAIEQLKRDLRKALNEEAIEMDHERLAEVSFCPEITSRSLALQLNLRKQTLSGDFFLILYPALDRRLALSPQVEGVTFELLRGESLESRAAEVFTSHFRAMEKLHGPIDRDSVFPGKSGRVFQMDIEVRAKPRFKKSDDNPFAALAEKREVSGSQELERVGRCLNHLNSNDLHVAILREDEVGELTRHFHPRKKSEEVPSPITLIGPGQVGKTAIIHEFLRREQEKASERGVGSQREIWLLSPQRMISGMSHVGQWEERAHAIFKEAVSRKHVLYFDDLCGLFQAGKTAGSDLTVGHLLKTYLEDGGLQVMGEATPEAWRRLREIDRGFADRFKMLRIREPSRADTTRILIRAMQTLESRHRCLFEHETLRTVLNLQERFVRARSFPGKAVDMLRQLAARWENARVEPQAALSYFGQKSGIRQDFLTTDGWVSPDEVAGHFKQRIIGQPIAIEAMTDTVAMATAQLNDPTRPLASLLFLGPTGVGKTESAKALATYFFGSDERMIRFDMNEFSGGDAVMRLIGSQARPRGLLTGAVRRQPYSVVLLDEIEKAHPAVFDLLLQTLGEGRLTDALGQVADFTNCLIVLTSNLGARSARHQLGFGGEGRDETAVYREAAQQFFRPELFNRLDRVVAFHELSREHISSLADGLTRRALKRQGIHSRRLNLAIDPSVHEALTDLGFRPEYGARALRRAIETHLVEPLALRVAEFPTNQPASVTIRAGEKSEGFQFTVSHFQPTSRVVGSRKVLPIHETEAFLAQVNDFLLRIDDEMADWFDGDNGGTFDPLDPLRTNYYHLRDELDFLRRMRERFASIAFSEAATPEAQRRLPSRFGKHVTSLVLDERAVDHLSEFYRSADPGKYLTQLAADAPVPDRISHFVDEIVTRCARLDFIVGQGNRPADRVFLRLYDSGNYQNSAGKPPNFSVEASIWKMYQSYLLSYLTWLDSPPNLVGELRQRTGRGIATVAREDKMFESSLPYFDSGFLYGEGPALAQWLAHEQGVQLFATSDGSVEHCRLEVFPLGADESVEDAYERVRHTELGALRAGTAVTRIHHENGYQLDLKTGRITNRPDLPLWAFLNPLMPVPEEFSGQE